MKWNSHNMALPTSTTPMHKNLDGLAAYWGRMRNSHQRSRFSGILKLFCSPCTNNDFLLMCGQVSCVDWLIGLHVLPSRHIYINTLASTQKDSSFLTHNC
jgi:hypothetical protein